jgi:geranylgeranyl diphosphate synthase, type II
MSKQVAAYQHWIETEIKKLKFGTEPVSLYQPIRYIMGLGGKRLRPLLALFSYSLFRDDPRSILSSAIAVEAFHNFTLMHDDIMDKAPLRRGKQTVHHKWNVNTAILSGDVMLVKVYEMLSGLDPNKLQKVLKLFNKCAAEVCEGQQWDMEYESTNVVSEAEYLAMIRLKTAVLLGFSMQLGALLAGAPDASQKLLREFGTNIGIGFQLKDDLLDAYADPDKFGKQVGGDILANKKTYLLITAREKATGSLSKELNAWLETKKFRKKEKIDAVKNIYDRLQVPQLTEKKVNAYFAKAFRNLDKLDVSDAKKQSLKTFVTALIDRQS